MSPLHRNAIGGRALILLLASLLLVSLAASAYPVQSQDQSFDPTDEAALKAFIHAYFDTRFAIFKPGFLHPQPASLARFVASSPRAQAFLKAEQDKLEIAQAHAQKTGLTYQDYSFTLDYQAIEPDDLTGLVSVRLVLQSLITYTDNAPDPVPTRGADEAHTLTLLPAPDGWQLVDDLYQDYLWRMLNASSESKQDWMKTIGELELNPETPPEAGGTGCELPADASTHAYDRAAAVAYARTFALDYNPNYRDFPNADCTNYVSQAIYAGNADHACKLSSDGLCGGTGGWYYVTGSRYAAAWTMVNPLHSFITDPATQALWTTGPEGCVVTREQAQLGDLMQFDWNYDGRYEHTVIITRIAYAADGRKLVYVSSHDEDWLDAPSSYFTYANPATRYIHIARIDGPDLRGGPGPGIYLPLINR